MQEARHVEVTTDADVARARHAARAAMYGHTDDTVYNAELVTSELVTNALLHGGGMASFTIVPIAGGARVEVADRNRRTPLVAVDSVEAMTGRGLHLVARLAARWGVDTTDDGKVVWAEVIEGDDLAPPHPMPDAQEVLAGWADLEDVDVEPPVRPTRARVVLGEVPTDLLVAAKRHVDNLVREFTLAAGGDRSGTTAPVPGPLAELIDRVVHRFEDARLEIKRQATEAARSGHSHTRLLLELPVEAADAAEEYLDALDAADRYCRANRFLTLETPPQHRVFRRWYIGELVKQLRAAAAGVERPPVLPFEQQLLQEVDNAEQARRAADRAARLYSAAVALAAAVTPEGVAAAVLREGADALGASGGGVLVATGDGRIAVPGTIGYEHPMIEKLQREPADADLPAAYTLRTGEPVWLETVEERDARFPALVGFEPETIAMCSVPAIGSDGVLGALRFSFGESRLFDDEEKRFVYALAAEAAEALQRAQLLESEREALRRVEHERASLEKLAALSEAMVRGRDLDAVLQLATDAGRMVSGAEYGAFFYNDSDDEGEVYSLYTVSGAPRSAFEGFPMPRNTAVFAPTFTGTAIVRLDDVTGDARYGRNPPYYGMPEGHLPVRSYLAVPVTLSNGTVVGGLFFAHSEPGRFHADAERLVAAVAGQAAAAIENVRSFEERNRVAAALQQGLLPAELPAVPGVDVAAVYAPWGEGVGGDFYDLLRLGDERWGIVVGDVRGRGPQAAALTAMARHTIRTAAILGRTPAGVLDVLNDALRDDSDPERFCTVIFGVLEVVDGGATFTYANAGHPPLAVVRAGTGEVALRAGSGRLAGILPDLACPEDTIALASGDALVLYTDGISEARRRNDGTEQFGDRRLVEALSSLRGETAAAIADGLSDAAASFAGGANDDDSVVFAAVVRP